MWPLLAEIKNFLIIFPNSSAGESWSYAAAFKDKPLKENNADSRQTGRVTITSPKVNIYHHCWAGPLLPTARKNEGRHKMITPTVECWGPEAVCLQDAVCVWHILCSAFSLVSHFPMTRQGSFSAGSSHRALHLQQGWFPRFQHHSASHEGWPWPVITGNGVSWDIPWGKHQIHKGSSWPILQCRFDFKSTINLPPGVFVLLT